MSADLEYIVSIIVPTYNQGDFIQETLTSVLDQTYAHWECIIINDGSTDNTDDIIRRFILSDPRFKYFPQANSGVVNARNFGISIAVGTFILPLDGDDKIHPKYLEKCVNTFATDPSIKVVYSRASYFGDSHSELHLEPYDYPKLLIKNMIYCTAMHYRLDSLAIGGFDRMMNKGLEDWEYWISLLKNGGKVIRLNEILFYYRGRPGTRSDSFTESQEHLLRSNIYMKHIDTYYHYFGDPISNLRDKQKFANELMSIRSNYIFKLFKRVGIF